MEHDFIIELPPKQVLLPNRVIEKSPVNLCHRCPWKGNHSGAVIFGWYRLGLQNHAGRSTLFNLAMRADSRLNETDFLSENSLLLLRIF